MTNSDAKAPPRYDGPKPSRIPGNMNKPGIHDPAFVHAVGFFGTFWPHTEDLMSIVFGELMDIKDDSASRQVFRSIINQRVRITIMKTLLEKSPANKDKNRELDDLIREYGSLNKARNTYLHGLWYTTMEGHVYLEEASDDYDRYFDARRVSIKEIEAVITRLSDFNLKLLVRLAQRPARQTASPAPQSDSTPSSQGPDKAVPE